MATLPQAVRTAAVFTAAGYSQSKPTISSCTIIVFQALLRDSQQTYGLCAPRCRTDLYLMGEEGFSQLCSIPQSLQGVSLVNEVIFFKGEAKSKCLASVQVNMSRMCRLYTEGSSCPVEVACLLSSVHPPRWARRVVSVLDGFLKADCAYLDFWCQEGREQL